MAGISIDIVFERRVSVRAKKGHSVHPTLFAVRPTEKISEFVSVLVRCVRVTIEQVVNCSTSVTLSEMVIESNCGRYTLINEIFRLLFK